MGMVHKVKGKTRGVIIVRNGAAGSAKGVITFVGMKPAKLISVRAHDKRVHRAQSALRQSRAEDEALRATYAAGPGRRPTATERDRAKARLMAFLTDDATQTTTSAAVAAPSTTQR